MTSMGVRAVAWLCVLVGSARADDVGVVGGRLLLRAGNHEVSLTAARAAVSGEVLALELRRGTQVLVASLDDDGFFWTSAPTGTYRLEYLRVGKRAEFFAPQELIVHAGALTCAGTLELEVGRIEALGGNVDNHVSVTDQCAAIGPRLRVVAATGDEQVAIARPGPPYEHEEGVQWRELASGLRAEVAIGEHNTAVRGLLRVPPLARDGLWSRWILLLGGGGIRGQRDEVAYDVTLGAGIHVGIFDFLAVSGAHWHDAEGVALGPVAAGVARLHNSLFGLGVRVEALPSRAAFVTVDVSPLGVLGSLL